MAAKALGYAGGGKRGQWPQGVRDWAIYLAVSLEILQWRAACLQTSDEAVLKVSVQARCGLLFVQQCTER